MYSKVSPADSGTSGYKDALNLQITSGIVYRGHHTFGRVIPIEVKAGTRGQMRR